MSHFPLSKSLQNKVFIAVEYSSGKNLMPLSIAWIHCHKKLTSVDSHKFLKSPVAPLYTVTCFDMKGTLQFMENVYFVKTIQDYQYPYIIWMILHNISENTQSFSLIFHPSSLGRISESTLPPRACFSCRLQHFLSQRNVCICQVL